MKTPVILAGLVLLLHGCSYAVSRDLVAQSDKTITFHQIQTEAERIAGKTVILGGEIVRTKNLAQGTLIELNEKPLDLWGKPKRTGRSGGRFLLFDRRFLDPSVYAPGREITMAAKVKGTYEKGIEQEGITYPLLTAQEVKLWERERPSDRPQWWDPLHDPYAPARRE